MKLPALVLIAFLFCVLSGCTKCYECSTSAHTRTFCKGSQEFVLLQSGAKMVDSNGETFDCKAQK